MRQVYICIDLKSFFASVECVERGLDPMTAKLVVADAARTDKTICLAVSPALKALGVKNRCRVFEIPKGLEYIMATPRMALYIKYSAKIYSVYLRHFSPEDIHVYSIDEVFIDISRYPALRSMSPREFALMLLREIRETTGLVATCGIGSNLYLAKIALDIISKHAPDFIGELNEKSYKELLWEHKPLTDFWRIGPGITARLERLGILTMRDIATVREDILYKSFGVDAELLIDHAHGRESTTIADIKAYKPKSSSITSGQVLTRDYEYDEGLIIVREMAEALGFELFARGDVSDSISLSLGYSQSSGLPSIQGSMRLELPTCSINELIFAAESIYKRIMRPELPIRRLTLCYANLHREQGQQYNIFTSQAEQERERRLQTAMLAVKQKYGSGSLLRCMDLQDAATARDRCRQIGGHRA